MEIETTETFLEQLDLGNYKDTFKERGYELGILKEKCENELRRIIGELKLPFSTQDLIISEIQRLKTKDNTALASETQEGASGIPKETSSDSHSLVNYHSTEKSPVEIRIVLLGKTGSGKSASGNTILGTHRFKSRVSGTSITRQCHHDQVIRFGYKILLVDTPGIFDTTQSNDETQNEINRCIGITSPGPHAFILVINAGVRYTEEERRSVDHFVRHFGENIFKYFVVLFTRKDDLDEEGVTLLDHIENCPADLRMFIEKCGVRVFAFNNREKNQEEKERQVIELLRGILKNVEENGSTCYTHRMYEDAEKILKKEEEANMKKREEELKQQHQKLEKQVLEKKIEQTENIIRTILSKLSDAYEKQNQNEQHVEFLSQQVELYKIQLKSKGDETKNIKKKLDELTRIYEESKYSVEQGAIAIENFQKESREHERIRQNYLKKDREEKEHMQRKLEDERTKIRDQLRKELENTKEVNSSCTIL